MNKLVPRRKKVYIICGFGEYRYVWEHLHEIIDVKKEELIVPYCFMEYEKAEERLKTITEELAQELNATYDEIKDSVFEQFLHRKHNHFKEYIEDANEIVLLLPEHSECTPDDISEKNQEIESCIGIKNKVIRTANLLNREKQKVIK